MQRDRLERRARLLLSWREKAQALVDGRRLPHELDLPQTMDARKAADYFAEQSRKARRETDAFRKKLHERLENAQDLVRIAVHQQRGLAARIDGGNINARAANNENRRLLCEIKEQGAEANLCHRVLAVETAEELGGFIDLPLPRYEGELERFQTAERSASPAPAPGETRPGGDTAASAGGIVEKLRALVPKRLGRGDIVAIAVAAVTIVLAALYFLYSTELAGTVGFDLLPAPQGGWILSLENRTGHAVTVAVPGNTVQAPRRADYAVFLEMQESGQTEFKRLSDTERAWAYAGTTGKDNGLLVVGAGMNGRWRLTPVNLAVPDPNALLRVVVLSGNRPVFAQDLAFETR